MPELFAPKAPKLFFKNSNPNGAQKVLIPIEHRDKTFILTPSDKFFQNGGKKSVFLGEMYYLKQRRSLWTGGKESVIGSRPAGQQ